MEIGVITRPVGLNLFIINGIAPDIALWLPNTIMG